MNKKKIFEINNILAHAKMQLNQAGPIHLMLLKEIISNN